MLTNLFLFRRIRPTLKPSTSIVSKASEFIDVYKYAPMRYVLFIKIKLTFTFKTFFFRPDPIYPTPQPDKTAAKCRKDVCQLPDCSCGGKEIPGKIFTIRIYFAKIIIFMV